MNNSIEPLVERAMTDRAPRFPGGTLPNFYLPAKVYESLPAAYITMGALLVSGAAYIGVGHGETAGYLGVGLSCVVAGITVKSIRLAERS